MRPPPHIDPADSTRVISPAVGGYGEVRTRVLVADRDGAGGTQADAEAAAQRLIDHGHTESHHHRCARCRDA